MFEGILNTTVEPAERISNPCFAENPKIPVVTGAEATEGTLVPTTLVAVTVNVYAVPAAKPVTVQPGVTGVPVFEVQVKPPGFEVAV
jgi:hypothetical protein